mmetsp:Transcript_10437/g.16313  ORF Transcript_10437/g.16313 Transcript_10437/m.16313 type:complete len:274 (-) Transcript_10437:1004-1825(-)
MVLMNKHTRYRESRTLVIAPARWWLVGQSSADCNAEDDVSGFSCIFEPISKCKAGYHPDIREFTPGNDPFTQEERFWVPEAYKSHGLLWFRAQLAAFLFRPRPDRVLEHVLPPGIAVHLRRGDKSTEIALPKISDYINAVRILCLPDHPENVRTNVVVVGDETESSTSLTQGLYELPCALNVSRTRKPSANSLPDAKVPQSRSGHLAQDFQNLNMLQMTVEAVQDLWIMSKSDVMVSTMSSNYGRLAYELNYAFKGGCPNPVISMDVLWHDPH